MGKVTVKESEELLKSGVLDKKTIETLRKKGLVSRKRNSTKRFILSGKNKVYPTMYFRGLGKGEKLNKEMITLREEWFKLSQKYTQEEK
tara:strand:+ start:1090 stop:1356 length:267 start_codon:yes stop_codon:yes gene_type:complete